MHMQSNDFIALSEIAVLNAEQRTSVTNGTGNAYSRRIESMGETTPAHGEAMRAQAADAKRRALNKLPDLLEQAEANLTANGVKVLWAADATEAQQQVLQIAQENNVKTVTKSKSMLTEEIALNPALEKGGMRVVETDLGEFIIQLNDEPPSHIIAPVIHKTKAEIRDIFVRELGMEPTDDAQQMVAFARSVLRKDFLTADMGISGGNFVIAETGTIGLVMNEGNGRMVTTVPRVHVALIGIEKIVETVDDYTTLVQVLSRSGTGQKLTVYTNILNGPRRENEADGPDEVYVIFVDNGRSDIYTTDYVEALNCIRCGACQNACPVYRNVGGHAYGWVYGGPIGAVVTPLLAGLGNAQPLPNASSLCGACKQVCPVDIDIPRMLLDLRNDLVEQGYTPRNWDFGMKGWAITHTSPWRFNMAGRMARLGQPFAGDDLPGVLGNWTQYRDFPDFAPKSFRQLWKERRSKKNGKG